MRWIASAPPAALLVLSLIVGAAAAQGQPKTPAGIAVWDTGKPSADMLDPIALAGKNDWSAFAAGATGDLKGDAVLSNGRIVAVLRRQDGAVAVHAVRPDGAVYRLTLHLRTASGEPVDRIERIALIENGKGSACLEASCKTAKGTVVAAKFRIKRGDVAVQVEPGTGAGRLRVGCDSRFVVLPDFFADDIAIDASKLPGNLATIDLPSENFVMQMIGQGDAIALTVFENRQHDVKVALSGRGPRSFTGSEIGFEGKKIWVALLDAPRIWHAVDLKAADKGKIVPLDWKMPFPAQWRVDFTRDGDMTDSWEMLLQEKADGDYSKPSWLGSGDQTLPASRKRWNTVLGTFSYPCWSDPAGQGYLQPLKNKALQFAGPVVVYPINRVKQTPLDAYTVVDVMRNTLGVGPCEHILDVEGQKAEYKGRATCSVRDTLNPIYAGSQQKTQRAKVDKTLDEGLIFVKHIRGRITRYVEFGHKMREYLAVQKKAHPELADFIAEMDKLTKEIDNKVAVRAAKIQTPEVVAKMNAEFRKNVLDYDGADALKRCRQYTEALVVIGDNQDELSGECRLVVRTLRQRAAILLAMDPRVAPIAAEIRARTQEALRNPANHEGARH